jgi:Xaa-Pro aminopeptidase
MNYTKRIKILQKKLKKKNLDAMLVSQPENRRYLCGYRGGDHGIGETSGVLIIPVKGGIHLLTDFRFELQAGIEAPLAEVHLYPKGLLELLKKLLPNLGVKRLGFESHYTLHSFAKSMKSGLARAGVHCYPLENVIEQMRVVKDEEEIETMRRSVLLNEKVFQKIYSNIKSYRTEIDLALDLEATMRKMGAEAKSFDTIVASGANGALPHAIPGTSKIGVNKSLTVDMGLILDNYCSDMTRNLVPGTPDKKYKKLHRLVREAQLAGIEAVRAGARCCDVDRAARSIISEAGYGPQFGHSLGHGVGLAVHEGPRLSALNRKKLKAGMVVTVEPGIYLPGWGGIRLENMVVVREKGCEILNQDTTWLDI